MKISILTLGCRTNQAESLYIEKQALLKGHALVSLNDNPDCCIINTCAVTSKADYQSRQLINRSLKKANKIFVTGCYATLYKESIQKDPKIILIENNSKDKISDFLNSENIAISNKDYKLSKARPIVKIQEGCNNNCSYCAIIQSRGRARSRNISEIIKEISEYYAIGYNEVVLTGTNIGQFGLDFNHYFNLTDLIELILEQTSIPKIRISSIEINYIDNRFINLFKNNRLCNHLHIPIQSGDNNILKYMNRPYSVEEFIDKICNISENIDNISIGSDIIVGFPYETDKEFLNTYKIAEELPFSYFHVFPFSKRDNSLASSFSNLSKNDEIFYRTQKLIELSQKKKVMFIKTQLHKVTDFIIEDVKENFFIGTTSNYLKSFLPFNKKLNPKDLVKIEHILFQRGQLFSKLVI